MEDSPGQGEGQLDPRRLSDQFAASNEASASKIMSSPPAAQRSLQDDDLALARILQEQERAFFLLQHAGMAGVEQEEDGAEEDAQPAMQPEEALDEEDEDMALARRLQQEDRDQALRELYAAQGIDLSNLVNEVPEAEIDGLGYDDLSLLGEVAGKVCKGLRPEAIAALPATTYAQHTAVGNLDASTDSAADKCCVCQLDFEVADEVLVLRCRHVHHRECLSQWLAVNKVCPMCNTEVASDPSAPVELS